LSCHSMQQLDLTLKEPFGRARVWTAGEGEPLLLIHGGIGDACTHWGKVAPLLSPPFRVFAPALPGYEGSDPLPRPSWPSLVDWVAAVLDALSVDRAVVCGNSFGGATARAFTSRYPGRVSRLFLVNGGLVPPIPPWVARMVGSALWKPLRGLMGAAVYSRSGLGKMIAKTDLLTDDFIKHAREQAKPFTTLMMSVGANGAPDFPATDVPTTLLWGAADKTLPEAKARELAAAFRRVDVILLEGAGHMPQVEAAEDFARVFRGAMR